MKEVSIIKKIFCDNLPHKGKLNQIIWKESLSYEVSFIYDDIQGKIKIIDYYKENREYYLKVMYNNETFIIKVNHFKDCHLGNILGLVNFKYKYNIGDIITDVKSGKLKILEQIRIKNGKYTDRGYKYKCLICGNKDTILESILNTQVGCNVCCSSPKKILIGYNDMWTTNPDLASKLFNSEDGYKYTQSSGQKVNWKCPDCGNIIENKSITNINREGLSCPKCGDKLPYPEKFMFNFLQQLNIGFTYQLTKKDFDWCGKYKYDFYFDLNNEGYCLESHGLGHYEEGFSRCGGRTLKEEQKNDMLKKKLALKNGIKEDNYIIIDCSKSELEWIKERIIDSQLNELFDLNKIDWLKCHEFACSSLVKKACELWNLNKYTAIEISNILKLDRNTIRKYLKQGSKIWNWCNYDPKEEMRKNGTKNGKNVDCRINNLSRKKVICLNDNKIFNSITEAVGYYNLNIQTKTHISACCKNKRKSAGKHPITGKKLRWMYYDDYIKVL